MKILSLFLILASFIVLTGCSTSTVKYDYDTEADFTNLNTFNWFAIPEKTQVNELAVKHVKNAVNRQLAAKGFRNVSDYPDLLIALYLGKQLKRDDGGWGYSYSRYGSYRASRPIDMYEEGTLTLDFVNAKTKELIWRGSAKAVIDPVLTPEEREKMINEVVSKILEKFPSVQVN